MTTTNQAIKHLTQRQATEAALTNEQVTRKRVERIERMIWPSDGHGGVRETSLHERLVPLESLRARGFRGRLRWLILGR